MAGTINYAYDPDQEVYVIHSCVGQPYVTNGKIIRIRADVVRTGSTLIYDIRLVGTGGTQEFPESDVFADKSSALTEYGNRVN